MNGTKYDSEMRSKALKAAALRGVVILYLAFLSFKMWSVDSSEKNVWIFRIFGTVFLAGAVGFGIYAWKSFRAADEESKKITAEEEAPDADDELAEAQEQ
ncbi:hypothetical protein [Ruminococcus flavefaciens]|uniref:Uncharacterized protein n=1 Tax=Ruminococcus flavefaciens 007c TaxID=1341157 RepID=W7V1Z9_RUMFL|nr:hypothetical protein [Ruminococcus flavefaciens]EWM55015.1 hypothetical protein RF007C_03190 [Ruminococcus flavefaciens 007c]